MRCLSLIFMMFLSVHRWASRLRFFMHIRQLRGFGNIWLHRHNLHETHIKLLIFHFIKGHRKRSERKQFPRAKVGSVFFFFFFSDVLTSCSDHDSSREISQIVTSAWPPPGVHHRRTQELTVCIVRHPRRRSSEWRAAPDTSIKTFPTSSSPYATSLSFLSEIRVADSSCCRGYIDMGRTYSHLLPLTADSSLSRTAHYCTAAQRGEAWREKSGQGTCLRNKLNQRLCAGLSDSCQVRAEDSAHCKASILICVTSCSADVWCVFSADEPRLRLRSRLFSRPNARTQLSPRCTCELRAERCRAPSRTTRRI